MGRTRTVVLLLIITAFVATAATAFFVWRSYGEEKEPQHGARLIFIGEINYMKEKKAASHTDVKSQLITDALGNAGTNAAGECEIRRTEISISEVRKHNDQ